MAIVGVLAAVIGGFAGAVGVIADVVIHTFATDGEFVGHLYVVGRGRREGKWRKD